MHVLICTDGVQRDHINGDGLDNRRANLRPCNHSQNQANQRQRKDNKSGFRGVGFHRASQKWYASIKIFGKRKHLGLFDSAIQASRTYEEAAHREFGRFAFINSGEKPE